MKFDVNKLTKEKQYCEELFNYYVEDSYDKKIFINKSERKIERTELKS